ncbi:MAG: hypothetical protein AAF945_02440 [Actinomycetota bacterium]
MSGELVLTLGDRDAALRMVGGGAWTLPTGVVTLLESELADPPRGRPAPEQLTNALGRVHDDLDEIIIDAPIVAAAPTLTVVGDHGVMLARVEIGSDDVTPPLDLARRDIDEVFRTIVAEPSSERVDNPGLDPDHVESIVATCCYVLAILRRLGLDTVTITLTDPINDGGAASAGGA